MTENSEVENSEVEKLEIVKFDIVRIEIVRLLGTDNLAPGIPVVVCLETENLETEFPDLGSKNCVVRNPTLIIIKIIRTLIIHISLFYL